MIIRTAEERDVAEMVEMAHEFETHLIALDDSLMQSPPPKETFRKFLEMGFRDPKHHIIVAEEDGRLVGMADFWIYPEFLHGGLVGYLNNLFVRDGRRGRGLGKALIRELMDEARRRGMVAIHVPVKPKNVRAKKLYAEMGIDEELVMMETRLDKAEDR
jgi:GNAT superfamily N-acetyltransferase